MNLETYKNTNFYSVVTTYKQHFRMKCKKNIYRSYARGKLIESRQVRAFQMTS